jgi:hypothetical protein
LSYLYIKLTSMKKQHLNRILTIAAVFVVITTLQSCSKLAQKLLNFDLSMQTQTVNVDVPPAQGNIAVGPITTYYNVDSFVRASTGGQLGAANISSVKITSCVITINNPNFANNFANFKSASASFYSNTDTNPYTLSNPSNPDQYAPTLTLPVDQTELSSYIGNQFTYSLSGSMRRPTTTTLHCTVTFTYSVKVSG